MDYKKLQELLHSHEGPSLDFKQEWYKLDSEGSQTKKIQKNEFIKDILSLANGNVNVAGETAYLVIGASDSTNEEGERELYDVTLDKPVTADRLLKMINRVCDPPLSHLDWHFFTVDAKKLYVVEIPSSPNVYEITEKVETSKRPFDEYTVFTRKGDQITTASSRERAILAEAKRLKFNEKRNAPPGWIGFIVGAVVGAVLLADVGKKYIFPETPDIGIASGAIAGIIFGGITGWSMGYSYIAIPSIWIELKTLSIRQRIAAILLLVVIFGVVAIAMDLLFR
jgi:hypothetical protein